MTERRANPPIDPEKQGQPGFQRRLLTSQADLDPKDRPLVDMVEWCQQRGNMVVLKSGMILTTDPTSRDVQNCKTMLINKGLVPGKVLAATQSLVTMLLANVVDAEESAKEKAEQESAISSQQQRLRILVQEAVAANVSDIHIEVRTDTAKIRFRKYGDLYLHAEWFPRIGREIAAVAFNKETDYATAHFNPLVPQDASMPLRVNGQDVRLRLASMPAHGGFDMVMRVLGVGDASKSISLEELGYTPEQVYIIKRAVQMPHGAVLLSGPTGSGKTTTLASCMHLVKDTRKVYTIEDPVEKVVPSVTQVPVNADKDDRSFATFGKAALRMDPDYIILGEMRDEDTASVMIRAAITGHLVFSTVHTNSATGIITRLIDMNVSASMLSDSNVLVALIFQRLAPILCAHCKIPITNSPAHQNGLERWQHTFGKELPGIYARGPGCEHCQKTGLQGRKVVAEVIWVDEPSRQFIQKADILGWQNYLKSKGWKSYQDRTIELVKEGQLDPLDAEGIIGQISMYSEENGFDYQTVRDGLTKPSNDKTHPST